MDFAKVYNGTIKKMFILMLFKDNLSINNTKSSDIWNEINDKNMQITQTKKYAILKHLI